MLVPGDMVRLRLDVEAMRASVLHVIASRHEEIESLVNQAVDEYIKGGGMERDLIAMVRPVVQEEIKQVLRCAVSDVLFHHGAVKRTLSALVVTALETMKEL